MSFDQALQARDTASHNHVQATQDKITKVMHYLRLDATVDTLANPLMIGQAYADLDYSASQEMILLLTKMVSCKRADVHEAREDLAQFFEKRLEKQINAMANEKYEIEVRAAA
ncbi:MAG TPA: hypothetical protein VN023_09440 [Methylovorus sp.]|nr:hypothetical protein [Methylovorus sp.]